MVGELCAGDCIGESLLISGRETHPYTITTSTHTRLGCMSYNTIIGEGNRTKLATILLTNGCVWT